MDRKYLLKSAIKVATLARIMAKAIDLFIVLILALFTYPVGIILSVIYICLCDAFQNGQSVGKKFMGFCVVSMVDGSPCTLKQSFIRNLPLSVPLVFAIIPMWGWIFTFLIGAVLCTVEVYFIFQLDSGHRVGDVMADTSVIASTPSEIKALHN